MALQILNDKFQPTAVQDVSTMAHIPVVGDFRIDITNTVVLSLSMDQTSSGRRPAGRHAPSDIATASTLAVLFS